MSSRHTLRCAVHGESEWTGQIICTHCGSVWHLGHKNPPTRDGRCTCGAVLSTRSGIGTARAICRECYKNLSRGPRVPYGPS